MKRILLWSLLTLVVLVVAVLSIVSVRVAAVDELAPPDPARPIVFHDGSSMPLSEVLDRSRRGLPLPVTAPTLRQWLTADLEFKTTFVVDGDPDHLMDSPLRNAGPIDDPVYALAEQNRADGQLEQALALYLSIPRDSEHYARARRLVAWNILARDMDQPEQAVRFADQSLYANPFDGNAWHDWGRVYARTLGLPVD